MQRKFPKPIKRVVVKLGSSVIATYKMKPREAHLKSLVDQICSLLGDVQVILVSSGAIVLGLGELNRSKRSHELAGLQATAAIGQAVLMKMYYEFFKAQNKKCAQVLLTWDDFDNRTRYNNIRSTFLKLMEWGVVPVINENDTVSTDEIKFGDNDKLSAMVACMVQADLLLILSDVEGFYDTKGSEKKIFEEIKEITQEMEGHAGGTDKSEISQGGMSAKLNAIRMATQSKIPCVIANGESENVLLRVLKGERIGTYFLDQEDKMLARQHWLAFSAKPKGAVTIDDGAKQAVLERGKSLLLPGIVSWDGHFKKDDVIIVKDKSGNEIGRGVSNYSVSELERIEDKKGKKEAIHCDKLVLSQK